MTYPFDSPQPPRPRLADEIPPPASDLDARVNDTKSPPGYRRISVMLPARMVATLDRNTPRLISRSAVVTEAVRAYLEARNIEVPPDPPRNRTQHPF